MTKISESAVSGNNNRRQKKHTFLKGTETETEQQED
jgi:hypothetical protein